MAEPHDQDEELMRAKLFASMKKKAPASLDAKKLPGPPDPKPNTADNIVIKSFDQIMREKKANDNNAGSSDEQVTKEKGLNRKRAIDLKNRQRDLALSRKQAKVVAATTWQAPSGESSTVSITRAKRAGQPVAIRARFEKAFADATASSKPSASSMASSAVKSPASQPIPSPKMPQSDDSVNLNSDQATAGSPEVVKASPAGGSPKQPYEQHLEALRREIEFANRIIDEFAQMDIPEFSDLNLDLLHDDDEKFIESMSTFLAGTVS